MNWNTVRLELARTREFPRGSISRAFLLRVPLDGAGMIDAAAMTANPRRATVQRLWSSQPDQSGRVVRAASGWCFSFPRRDGKDTVFGFDGEPLRLGGSVGVTDPDGNRLSFRVANLSSPDRKTSTMT